MRRADIGRNAALVVTAITALASCAKNSSSSEGAAPDGAGGASILSGGGSNGGAIASGGSQNGAGGVAGANAAAGNGGAGGNAAGSANGGTASGTGGTLTASGGAAGAPSLDAGTVASGSIEGDVHVVKRMGDPSFDSVVTNPSPSTITWLNDHFYRMEVFTTFFDDKTSFYPNGWVYSDSEAVYVGSNTANAHPDWILSDPQGKHVYLDWGCSGGACPQYAADITNAGFRADWIANLKSALAKGYRGAWIDDVNLALRFSDGSQSTTAHSPTTNTTITEDVWAAAVTSFMTEARGALSGYELLHNSIWYARPTRTADTFVQQEILAADVINMEGGFASDGGLTGGTGEWSVSAKMDFADAVHAAGRWVVVDDFPSTDTEREYALACYLLLSNGRDAIGDASMAPTTWWKGYDVHLGKALGPRTRSASGLFRREFEHGLVLMLEPSAADASVPLSGTYQTVDGVSVTQVALTSKRGAVLVAP